MIMRLLGRWRVRRRLQRAIVPEAEAVALAERKGFKVIATRLRRDIRMRVDDESMRLEVRADLLLTKWRRRYVGQVRSGREALDPAHRDTRQQLMEYRVAFGADGVLLVDIEGRKLKRVEFGLFLLPRVPRWMFIALGGFLGALAEARLGWMADGVRLFVYYFIP